MKYVELHSSSAFSFLEGASRPEDLVSRAKELEMQAIALVDRDGVYGSPRFHMAAKSVGIRAHVGSEVSVGGFGNRAGLPSWMPNSFASRPVRLPLLVESRTGYLDVSFALSENGGFRVMDVIVTEMPLDVLDRLKDVARTRPSSDLSR